MLLVSFSWWCSFGSPYKKSRDAADLPWWWSLCWSDFLEVVPMDFGWAFVLHMMEEAGKDLIGFLLALRYGFPLFIAYINPPPPPPHLGQKSQWVGWVKLRERRQRWNGWEEANWFLGLLSFVVIKSHPSFSSLMIFVLWFSYYDFESVFSIIIMAISIFKMTWICL